MFNAYRSADNFTDGPSWVRVGPTAEVFKQASTDPGIRLAIHFREREQHIVDQLRQVALTDQFEEAWRKSFSKETKQFALDLPNSPASLKKLQKQLHELCPGLEIIADRIFRYQMAPYFENYPEIDELDVETRCQKGTAYPADLQLHADAEYYEKFPNTFMAHLNSGPAVLLRDVTDNTNLFYNARADDAPLIRQSGTGNPTWVYSGKRNAWHRTPVLGEGDYRVVSIVSPSQRYLNSRGIWPYVPG